MACSDNEDLKPSGLNDDYFTVSSEATDEISVLRREFYKKNGVHLVFNDTIYREQIGTDDEGNPRWFIETLDLGYSLTASDGKYVFDYLQTQSACEKCIEILETKLLNHLGGDFRPYSVFLVEQIYENRNGQLKPLDLYDNYRCLALSMKTVLEMSDENDVNSFCQSLLTSFVMSKVNRLEEDVFSDFFSFSSQYYSKMFSKFDIPTAPSIEVLYPLGFIGNLFSSYSFPSQNEDLEAYIEAIFVLGEQEFTNRYGTYSIIMNKYNELKQILSDIGYKF